MKTVLLISLLVLISNSTIAGEIQLSGTDGLKYTGTCENMVGQKFDIRGSVPGLHMIASRRPFVKCKFLKLQPNGVLRVSVDQSLDDGAEVYRSKDRGSVFEIPNGRLLGEVKLSVYETNRKGEERPYQSTDDFRKVR